MAGGRFPEFKGGTLLVRQGFLARPMLVGGMPTPLFAWACRASAREHAQATAAWACHP
jgi:hypothetical protein